MARIVLAGLLCSLLSAGGAVAAPVPVEGDLTAREGTAQGLGSGSKLLENDDLPEPVARTRKLLMDIARAGDIEGLAAVIEDNGRTPLFSFGGDEDPIAFWREVSGDGEGREVLAILLELLETPPALMREGSAEAFYAWPYFEALHLEDLSPAQQVELFTLVTAGDYRDMLDFGGYIFYRVHISPDGTWEAFVAGD